eukprot:26120_5
MGIGYIHRNQLYCPRMHPTYVLAYTRMPYNPRWVCLPSPEMPSIGGVGHVSFSSPGHPCCPCPSSNHSSSDPFCIPSLV